MKAKVFILPIAGNFYVYEFMYRHRFPYFAPQSQLNSDIEFAKPPESRLRTG